jgi:hypothetical protein
MRFYFYEKINGKLTELDTPLNGKVAIGCHGYAKGKNGEFVKGTMSGITLANFANDYEIKGERDITANDFPGKTVIVKHWFPKDHDMATEFFTLQNNA